MEFHEEDVSSGLSGNEIIDKLGFDPSNCTICTPDGQVSDMDTPLSYPLISVVLVPGSSAIVATMMIIVIVAVVTATGVAIGLAIMNSMNKVPKIDSAASLRGSSNTARLNKRLPIILGKHLVYPDICAQPYTSYANSEQYLHQMFCFGYRNVKIDESTIKIGTTPISKFTEAEYELSKSSFTTYPDRAMETYIGIELKDQEVIRTTASSCKTAYIGICSPSGFFQSEGDEKKAIPLGLHIKYRKEGTEAWTDFYNKTTYVAVDVYREPHKIDFPSPGTYEISVLRTTEKSSDSTYIDNLYWEMMTCFTSDSEGDTAPVKHPLNYSLLAVKIRASNQLNGTIDSLNAVGHLETRYWNGYDWVTGATRNPASGILYLLTDKQVNARAVSDDIIDWDSFREFYEFCELSGFKCDACITDDYTIEDLCQYICQSNLASMIIQPSKISIRIDKAQGAISQLFTPRNARNISMSRSFESLPKIIKAKFNSEVVGYTEVERTIRLMDDRSIEFDTEIGEDEEAEEINLAGVTDAEHAARVMAVRLKQIHAQSRSYTFETDIEGLVCIPGDVVLLSTDSFLYGLGEGRIESIGIGTITVDSEFTFIKGHTYGLQHRNKDGVINSVKITSFNEGSTSIINVGSTSGFTVGDLVSFGYLNEETHKVQISSISVETDKICKIEAVDYEPSVFDTSMTIPAFDPGISLYPEGTGIGQGKQDIPDHPVIQGPEGAFVEYIVQHYLVSDKKTGVSISDKNWSEDPSTQIPSQKKRYLWQYDTYVLTNGRKYNTTPIVIREYGSVLIEYTWAKSRDEEPIKYLYFKLNGDYITLDGKRLYEEYGADWYSKGDLPPQPDDKPYLWWRVSGDGGETWELSCITGNESIDFDLLATPEFYTLSSRGVSLSEQQVVFSVDRKTLPANALVIWEYPELSGVEFDQVDNNKLTATISVGAVVRDISVSASVTNIGTKIKVVSGAETGTVKPAYLGSLKYEPASVPPYGEPLIEGDCYLPIFSREQQGTDTDTKITYKIIRRWSVEGKKYYWRNLKPSDNNYSEIAAVAEADIFSSIPEDSVVEAQWGYIENIFAKFITAEKGYIKKLTSDEAFIKMLSIYRLIVDSEANGFKFEVASIDGDGNTLPEPIIKVSSKKKTIFQIVSSTGRIFLGEPNVNLDGAKSGFMYDPDDSTLHSAGDNTLISASGTIATKNMNSENANIANSNFSGNFNCIAIRTQPGASAVYRYTIRASEKQNQAVNLLAFLRQCNPNPLSGNEFTTVKIEVDGYPSIQWMQYAFDEGVGYGQVFEFGQVKGTRLYFYDNQFKNVDLHNLIILKKINITTGNESAVNPNVPVRDWSTVIGSVGEIIYFLTKDITFSINAGGNGLYVNLPFTPSLDTLESNQVYIDKDYSLKMKP